MRVLKVLAVGVTIGGIALAMNNETASAAEWTPRTVDQIKSDIKGNEYTIVWGDTLSGISQATNISVDALAQRNSIENVDLIFAGNKLIFEGNVVTVENKKGETVAQTVIKPEEKVDSNKNIGEPVDSDKTTGSSSSTDQGSNNGGTTTSSTAGGNTSNSDSTGGSNTGGSNTGGSNTGGSNTGGSNTGGSNTGGSNTGGSNTGGSDTGGGNTGGSEEPSKPAEPTIVSGYIGNSGKVFGRAVEANTWANGQIDSGIADDNGYSGYKLITIFYSDGSEKFSIDWY